MTSRATVFIPSLDRRRMLLDTLRSLVEQTTVPHIVVIDNGSTDGSVQAVRRDFPDTTVLELGCNRGFGPALNEAVRRHPAELLIFANNDVRYEPRFVEALTEEFEAPTSVVAGVLLDSSDPRRIDSAGVVVDPTLLAFDYLHGLPVSTAHEVDPPLGPTGGAALVPLTAFEAVGGFDPRIFAYLEDVDLALRLRGRGVSCRLADSARGVHRHSSTLGSGSRTKNRLMGWSRGYMLRRYGVLRTPRRAVRALAGEVVICAGQAVIDRNVSGIVGRVHGWRAAAGLPRLPVPPGAAQEIGLVEALRRRSVRRPRRPLSSRPREEPTMDRAADHR